MLSDLYPGLSFPDEDPEFEVWNHLESGLQLAEDELNYLGDMEYALVEAVSRLTSEMLVEFVSEKEKATLFENLSDLMSDPWVKHAVEVKLARRTVARASGALERYQGLVPVFSAYEMSDKQRRYLSEAIESYLLGFDAACIAFCGATIEQLLVQACQDREVVSIKGPEDRTPSFSHLLKLAAKFLPKEVLKAAERAGKHRNRVMHRHIWEDKILSNIALGSVKDLSEVVRSLPQE